MDEAEKDLETALNETLEEVKGKEVVPDDAEEEPVQKEEVSTEPEQEEKVDKEEETPEEEEPLGLSAEQLDIINKTPELRAAYKSMQAGLTKKTMIIAEERKTLEKKAQVAEWLERDPVAAANAILQAQGVKVGDQPKTKEEIQTKEATDELTKEWAKALGSEEAANVFKPLLEKHMDSFMQHVLRPLQEQQYQLQAAAQERAVAASLSEFESRVVSRGETMDEDIKREMAEKMANLQPSEEAKIDDYLGELYNAVMYDRYRKGQVQSQLKRLKNAKASTEPTTGSRPRTKTEPTRITADMSEDDALKAALAMAESELAG